MQTGSSPGRHDCYKDMSMKEIALCEDWLGTAGRHSSLQASLSL